MLLSFLSFRWSFSAWRRNISLMSGTFTSGFNRFFFFCSMSFLRASEKRQELNEKRKQLEETRCDKPQEKEVVCTGVVVSCMTAKLKLAYRN